MTPPYQTIHSFFDYYSLVYARTILKQLIKAADSEKTWKYSSPCDVVCFTEKINELIGAVYSIVGSFDQRPEAVLDKEIIDNCWQLTGYDSYCGGHRNDTAWDFFPRHLSKKEFIDPYKALEKFTRYRNSEQWKEVIKELEYHALADTRLDEFADSKSMLLTYIHLHKLIEATHLIEVRMQPKSMVSQRR
jgi:hypothetical protein